MLADAFILYRFLAEDRSPLPDQAFARYVFILEDKRFLYHIGFDPIATMRASLKRLIGRPKGGASTIDMQLVRTLTNRREKTMRRKVREIILAVYIRLWFGRARVLSCYLSHAYSGYATRGIPMASKLIFSKTVEECSRREKAILASIILVPAPTFRSLNWSARVVRRAIYAQRSVSMRFSDFLAARMWEDHLKISDRTLDRLAP